VSVAVTFARLEGLLRGFYPVKILRPFFAVPATVVHLVPSPSE
jgi:hypothetical protein